MKNWWICAENQTLSQKLENEDYNVWDTWKDCQKTEMWKKCLRISQKEKKIPLEDQEREKVAMLKIVWKKWALEAWKIVRNWHAWKLMLKEAGVLQRPYSQWRSRNTGLSKKMDGIWNRYNLKSTGLIYTLEKSPPSPARAHDTPPAWTSPQRLKVTHLRFPCQRRAPPLFKLSLILQ